MPFFVQMMIKCKNKKQDWSRLLFSFAIERSDIEIEGELEGNRTHAHRIDLIFGLVLDPLVDNILGKYVPFEKELVVFLKGVEGLLKAPRSGGDVSQFLGRKPVDVLVERLTRIDLVLDPVKAGHQEGGKGKVTVT